MTAFYPQYFLLHGEHLDLTLNLGDGFRTSLTWGGGGGGGVDPNRGH